MEGAFRALSPYAELARLHKPTGALLIYFPSLYGSLLVASLQSPPLPPLQVLSINGKFLLGSFLFRCLGCTWNDLIDQDLDRQVKRTRTRPLARRAITTKQALAYALSQLMLGIILTRLLLPTQCMLWAIPSVLLTVLYPFAKYFTNYPQLILGLVFSWGVPLSFPAFKLSHRQLLDNTTISPAVFLYLICISWVMVYDTIYSNQDVADDLRRGVGSPAVKHRQQVRQFLWIFATILSMGLVSIGILIAAGPYFMIGANVTSLLVAHMVDAVELDSPASCGWWFSKGNIGIAIAIAATFMAEYVHRLAG